MYALCIHIYYPSDSDVNKIFDFLWWTLYCHVRLCLVRTIPRGRMQLEEWKSVGEGQIKDKGNRPVDSGFHPDPGITHFHMFPRRITIVLFFSFFFSSQIIGLKISNFWFVRFLLFSCLSISFKSKIRFSHQIWMT